MTAINSNRAIRGPVTAVPVVAGKGVRLVADTVNNRWVVEADETVLWSGFAGASDFPLTLSESLSNFEKVEFTWIPRYQGDYGSPTVCDTQGTDGHGGTLKYTLAAPYWNANSAWFGWWFLDTTDNQTKLTSVLNAFGNPQTTTPLANGLSCRMVKIVGVNRKSA